MASGRRRGGTGSHDNMNPPSASMNAIMAGLGFNDTSAKAKEEMRRVIASSDCDRAHVMEMFESMNMLQEEPNRNRVWSLHDAARKGAVDTCKHLVEKLGFDVNSVATDGSGLTPLACAVSHGKAIAARYFLDKDADPNKQDSIGFAPLHYAAKKGYDGIARLLISRGASVNASSPQGTPLHVAASLGKSGVLQILLDHHADPDMVSPDLHTPLAACLLLDKYSDSDCLKCVKLLVEAGADLNSTNPDTPLVIATSKGLTECVTYLLEVGADANIPTKHDGRTPIEIAAKAGRRKLVDILFPFTSPILDLSNWSVEGIIAYAKSGLSKDKHKGNVQGTKAHLKLLGRKAVDGMDYTGALKFYAEAIELDPDDATLYSNQSLCHLKIGEAMDALQDANACIRLRPEWEKGYYRKGAALMSLKEYKEACDAFMHGLELDPGNVGLRDAYWDAAEAMRAAGQNGASLD